MARCSVAKPFGAAVEASYFSRRRRQLAASATTSPVTTPRALRLPALKKQPKPPPPLFPRPKLPVATTFNDTPTTTTTTGNGYVSKKPPTDGTNAPSSSGAGDVLRLMDALRLPPDEDVYVSLLRDCTDAAEVAVVHAHIAGSCAAFGLPMPLANRVLIAYASCGDTRAARQMFDGMPIKDGITWAAMISAYSDGCFHDNAIRLFARMCHEVRELAGDCYAHAIVAVLRSCARVSKQKLGEQVHALLVKKNGVRHDTGSSLLQLYCRSGQHNSARQVLDMMRFSSSCQEPVPEAAWTSMITSCHRGGLLDDAIDVFRDMVSSGVARSSFSLSSILVVCAESENQRCYGQQVHADAIKHGVDTNQFVMSGLVHMYAKQGRLADAARAFQAVGGKPDAVCWNAMVMAYARGGRYREATRVMYQMKAAGMKPSELMMNEVRQACFR